MTSSPRFTRWLAASLITCGGGLHAQDRTAPSLGAHVFLAQGEGLGVSPATTPPVDTQAQGSLFLVFNAGYASNDSTPHDTYANRWGPLGQPQAYANYGHRFAVRAYVAANGKGGPAHGVSIEKRGEAKGELSLSFVEVRHASRVASFARTYAGEALQVVSGTVTVDGPATLLAFWWGDGGVKRMRVSPGDGFTLIDAFVQLPDESGVQGAVAWRQVTAAGSYRVHWTAAPVQGAALWLIALQ
jgi:hypothetical protein